MLKSPRLEEFCKKIDGFPADWDAIIARYKEFERFYNPNDAFDLSDWVGITGEILSDIALETAAASDKGVVLDPSLRSFQRNRYLPFRAYYSETRRLIINPPRRVYWRAEYDRLVKIDDIYVVFETRIAQSVSGAVKRNRKKGKYGLMRPEVYDKKLYPIRKLLGRDVGYVLVIPRTKGLTRETLSEIQREFLYTDGLVVHLYTDRRAFREECRRAVLGAGLPLRDNNVNVPLAQTAEQITG